MHCTDHRGGKAHKLRLRLNRIGARRRRSHKWLHWHEQLRQSPARGAPTTANSPIAAIGSPVKGRVHHGRSTGHRCAAAQLFPWFGLGQCQRRKQATCQWAWAASPAGGPERAAVHRAAAAACAAQARAGDTRVPQGHKHRHDAPGRGCRCRCGPVASRAIVVRNGPRRDNGPTPIGLSESESHFDSLANGQRYGPPSPTAKHNASRPQSTGASPHVRGRHHAYCAARVRVARAAAVIVPRGTRARHLVGWRGPPAPRDAPPVHWLAEGRQQQRQPAPWHWPTPTQRQQ